MRDERERKRFDPPTNVVIVQEQAAARSATCTYDATLTLEWP
jgi:hypothetical protein